MIAGVVVPWEVAVRTGDIAFADEHYETARDLVDFQARHVDPTLGIITWGYYGDWLQLEDTPKAQVTGWAQLLAVSHLVDLAKMTGKSDDVQRYSGLLARLKAAYHAAYFSTADGFYHGGTQVAQVLPLFLQIPPTKQATATTLQRLLDNLAEHGNSTTSGIVGTAFMLQVLHNYAPELALEIASKTTEPSWGYMIRTGPGTIWETWTDSSNSHNHPALGATISRYLYQLAGFSRLDASTWTTSIVEVRPSARVIRALRSANVSVETVHGRAAIEWTAEGDALDLKVAIPPGMQGEIHFQVDSTVIDRTSTVVWTMGKPQHCGLVNPSCLEAKLRSDHADGISTVAIRVSSGTHHFQGLCR